MTNDERRQDTPPMDSGAQTPPPPPGGEEPRPRQSTRTRSSAPRKQTTDDRVKSSTAEANGGAKTAGGARSGKGTARKPRDTVDTRKGPPRSSRPAHRVIPYLLTALGIFLTVCLVLNLFCNIGNKCESDPSAHLMGSVGYYICYGLFGLFGPAVFLLPILIFALAAFWKSWIDRDRQVLERSISGLVLLVLLSAMIHVFCLAALPESDWSMSASELIAHGARMTGGGLFGGGVGYFLVRYLNVLGGIIVSIFLTILALFFYLGMTPQYLMEHIRANRTLKRSMEPLDVTVEEHHIESIKQKIHRAGSGEKKAAAAGASDSNPPDGAVRYTEPDAAPSKKADSKLAPMPHPILDATDEAFTEQESCAPVIPDGLNTEPAGKKTGAAGSANTVSTGNTGSAAQAASAGSGRAAGEAPAPGTAVPRATAPAAPNTAGAQSFSQRPAAQSQAAAPRTPSPAAKVQAESIDPIFPRNSADFKSVGRVQKADRGFELGSIFINLDDHEQPTPRRHAPVPPEVPMPGSVHRSNPVADALAGASGPAGAGNAPRPSAANGAAGTQSPAGTPRSAGSAAAGSAAGKPGAPAGAPVQKPIFRPADKNGRQEFGLSEEAFEQREASIPMPRASGKPSAAPGSAAKTAVKKQQAEESKPYIFPPISYLHPGEPITEENQAEIAENMEKLAATLADFKISIREITYSCGPTVTRYEIFPSAGTRVRNIMNTADDIALAFAVQNVRMETIEGKSAIGVEVPNKTRQTVYLRELLESPKFTESDSKLTVGLGKGVTGQPIYFNIAKMPHLLIGGTTGSGKSICINSIIMSILFKARPDEVKLIMIDPKKVEFTPYKGIPHLMAPIITTPKDAAGALQAAVNEMEDRFALVQEFGVRNIDGYNALAAKDPELTPKPVLIIIIDELADLMMTAGDEVEESICRLAQKARAASIYVIVGTQRPSVDVVTGLIKSNIPSRIACTVRSQIDSRTILDFAGAEKLLGRGDMLFAPIGSMMPTRVQGAFVSDDEVEKICEFIRATNGTAEYDENFTGKMKEYAAQCGQKKGKGGGDIALPGGTDDDAKYVQAIGIFIGEKRVSTSLLQRKLGIGYGKAAKLIDRMEEEGLVSKSDGTNKPRAILISAEQYMERYLDGNSSGNGDAG